MMKESLYNVVQGLKPTLVMVIVQIAFAGTHVLYKLAVNDGMNLRIAVAYRLLFATAFMAPLAFILERNKRIKMTWTILFQYFLCGLFGVEKFNIRTKAGKAKIVGTIVGIGGAMVLTFVKGVEIKMGSFQLNLLHHQNGAGSHQHTTISTSNAIFGSLYAMASSISFALWLIIQTKLSERYPTHYSGTTLVSFWASLLSCVFALCFERDFSQWKLDWNIRLLTVAYGGIVVSGVMGVLISWCVHMRGPLFASIFTPLLLVIVALAGSTMLNEKLYLGSHIGAVLIICGLYAVVWGNSEEIKRKNELVSSQNSNELDTIESREAR